MSDSRKDGHLLIVDNRISGWTGLRYLQEWAPLARAFDIATGYFEIGALLGLDGQWQPLEKIRILMGTETTCRTRQALLEAATQRLEDSLEAAKALNPFLKGVPAIVDALQTRQIECRVYDRDKFHAKAYITHAKLGKQLLTPEDDYDALKEFNHHYEGNQTVIENLHLEYQALIKE